MLKPNFVYLVLFCVFLAEKFRFLFNNLANASQQYKLDCIVNYYWTLNFMVKKKDKNQTEKMIML